MELNGALLAVDGLLDFTEGTAVLTGFNLVPEHAVRAFAAVDVAARLATEGHQSDQDEAFLDAAMGWFVRPPGSPAPMMRYFLYVLRERADQVVEGTNNLHNMLSQGGLRVRG